MRRSIFTIGIILLAVILAWTPFYSIGYLALICLGIRFFNFSKILSTVASRLLVSLFIFCGVIAILASLGWLLHISILPIYVVATFLLVLLAFWLMSDKVNRSPVNKFDTSDAISLGVAFVIPVILLISYFIPQISNASVYQVLANGWDNGWHINIMQNTSTASGYVNFHVEKIDGGSNSQERFHAYPQAWHFANSHIADGFGVKVFSGDNPILTMQVFFIIFIAWLVITGFLLSKLSWFLLNRLKPQSPSLITRVALFALAQLPVLLIVFAGSVDRGFPNYMACLAYILVFVALLIDYQANEHRKKIFATLVLVATTTVLFWIVPLPALVIALFLGIFIASAKRHKWTRSDLPVIILALISIAALVIQIAMFVIFTSKSDDEAINAGSINGTFPVSVLLTATLAALAMFGWQKDKKISLIALVTVGSFTILSLGIYAYQLFSAGVVSYYFPKTLAITLVVASVFYVPLFVSYLEQARTKYLHGSRILTLFAAVVVLSLLFVGTGQSTKSANSLFQRNSKVSTQVAREVITYLKTQDPDKTSFVILRGESRDEDKHGHLVGKLWNRDFTCAYWVTNPSSLKANLSRLDSCADMLNQDIFVVTSPHTKSAVESLRRDNIKIINIR